MTNPEEFVADVMHGLVDRIKDTAVLDADRAHKEERDAMQALRLASGTQGVNASVLLQQLTGDSSEKRLEALNTEMDRVTREADAAVKAKEAQNANVQTDKYPPPVITTAAP